jgi:hypothetical protein
MSGMLKLTILTPAHSSHAETDNFNYDTIQPCWNWPFWPQYILDIFKRVTLSATYFRTAETDDFDHDTSQPCFNWWFKRIICLHLIVIFLHIFLFWFCCNACVYLPSFFQVILRSLVRQNYNSQLKKKLEHFAVIVCNYVLYVLKFFIHFSTLSHRKVASAWTAL